MTCGPTAFFDGVKSIRGICSWHNPLLSVDGLIPFVSPQMAWEGMMNQHCHCHHHQPRICDVVAIGNSGVVILVAAAAAAAF